MQNKMVEKLRTSHNEGISILLYIIPEKTVLGKFPYKDAMLCYPYLMLPDPCVLYTVSPYQYNIFTGSNEERILVERNQTAFAHSTTSSAHITRMSVDGRILDIQLAEDGREERQAHTK
jgi:hypothetical protein